MTSNVQRQSGGVRRASSDIANLLTHDAALTQRQLSALAPPIIAGDKRDVRVPRSAVFPPSPYSTTPALLPDESISVLLLSTQLELSQLPASAERGAGERGWPTLAGKLAGKSEQARQVVLACWVRAASRKRPPAVSCTRFPALHHPVCKCTCVAPSMAVCMPALPLPLHWQMRHTAKPSQQGKQC